MREPAVQRSPLIEKMVNRRRPARVQYRHLQKSAPAIYRQFHGVFFQPGVFHDVAPGGLPPVNDTARTS